MASRPVPKTWLMGTELFEGRMPHHDGIKALWETKWKFPCTKSVYPFHDGRFQDFAPIFEHLIHNNINDGTSPEYTSAFFPIAEALAAEGDAAAEQGDRGLATDLYLRSACVYRIARFPYITGFPQPSCETKWRAWTAQKDVYMRAASAWECPVQEVAIPHPRPRAQGNDRPEIPAYLRVPNHAAPDKPCPVVILITGLDGYRPDNTVRLNEFLRRGWASITLEIPGTADSPADPADPESIDRLWDSVFEWAARDGRLDTTRFMVWGLSSGGYYAIRIAHTHRDKVIGSVAQGAGCHYFFDKGWLDKAEGHEYPFPLLAPLAQKFGYADSIDEFKHGSQAKFSLLSTGLVHQPSTRLLLINGMNDGLMPVEDSTLLFEYGSPKEARFFPNALHMGYPMANDSVYPWMESVVASIKP